MIKKLFKYTKGYRKEAIFASIITISDAVIEVILPFYIAAIIDYGIAKHDINSTIHYGIILLILATITLLFGIFWSIYTSLYSAGFAKNIRQAVFDKIQTFSFKNIDKFSTASLITRLTTDITNVQNTCQTLIRLLKAPFMIIFALIMASRINTNLSTMFFILIPVLAIGLIFVLIKAHPYFKKGFAKYDEMNNVIQENVSAIRVVKSYNRQDFENSKLNKVAFFVFNLFRKADKIVAYQGPFIDLVVFSFITILAFISTKLIVSGDMTTGNLASLIIYSMQILNSMLMISFSLVIILIGQASTKRIVEVLSEESDITNPTNPIYEVKDGSITFENVYFSYDKTDETSEDKNYKLKNISIDIKSGETIGIIGDTGSSKTSFVQLIPRLYDVKKGQVKVGGVNVKDYDLKVLRDNVAFVLQKNTLFSGTIKENLKWGNKKATDKELINACKLSQADEFVKKLTNKYNTVLEQGGTNLSGGQRQRLCIARALLKKPKILILDDSTSAVDTKTDAKIRKAFKEKIPNITKIIIAQRIDSIKDADKIIVLSNGKISGFANHKTLLKTNKIYKEVYDLQIKEKNKK